MFKKIIPLIFLIAGFFGGANTAHAQYTLYQNCQLQTTSGQAIAGASVYFLTQPANTTTLTPLANVYSSTTGGSVTQPLLTNNFGACTAYLSSGTYTVCYVSTFTGKTCYADQLIPFGSSKIDLTSQVTGTLPIANGGTAATTSASALTNLLPGASSDGNNGVIISGAVTAKSVNYIVNAASYPGADCGAKINAADVAYTGTPIEIDVNASCGIVFTTPIVLHSNHNLKFTQTSNYTLAPGNEVLGNNTIDFGNSTVTLASQSGGTAIGMWNFTDGTTVASNVVFQGSGAILDGNAAGQTAPCDHIYTCTEVFNIQGTISLAPHDIRITGLTIQNTQGSGILIHGASENPPYSYNVTIDHSIFQNVDLHGISGSGFDHNLSISDNTFTAWGLSSLNTNAAVYFYQNNVSVSAPTNFKITKNHFKNTTATEFAIELYDGNVGGYFQNTVIANNTFDAGGQAGGSGLSVALYHGSIANNTFMNGAVNCTQRCGMELPGQYISVTSNSIQNGTIAIISDAIIAGQHDTIDGNTISISGASSGTSGIIVSGGSGIAFTDAVISNNVIDLSSTTSCQSGIYVGVYGSSSQTNQISVLNNHIYGPGSLCNGVRILNLASPQSSGIQIKNNDFVNLSTGVFDSATDTSTTDITIESNHYSQVTSPVSISLAAGSIWRNWDSITNPTDSSQYLNGGASVSGAGQLATPGGVASGSLSQIPTTNLVGIWDAGNASNCSVDGANVTSMLDSSGNGVTLTPLGTQAICKLAIVNGQNVFRFVSTGSGYQNTTTPAGLTASTVFVVYYLSSLVGNPVLTDDFTYNLYGPTLYYTGATTLTTGPVGSGTLSGTAPAAGSWHIATLSATTSNGKTVSMSIDGTQIASGTQGATTAATTGFTVGSRTGGTSAWNGDIAYVALYNTQLSASNTAAVLTYLKHRFGISVPNTWYVDSNGNASLTSVAVGGAATIDNGGISVNNANGGFFNTTGVATDPGTINNGEQWYNTTLGRFKYGTTGSAVRQFAALEDFNCTSAPTGTANSSYVLGGNCVWQLKNNAGGGTPTMTCGAGAGTSPSVCTITGVDGIGTINITTGSSPTSAATIATITVANACGSAIIPHFSAANAAAASLSGNTHAYVNPISTTQWSLISNATGLAASTAYKWTYDARCY